LPDSARTQKNSDIYANFELTSSWEMAGKHTHENDGQENVGNMAEVGHDEQDKFLGDDD